jgi:AcrR family transcriptional regulator
MERTGTDLRSTLLRSAAEVVAKAGVREISIRELARQAGVSHAAHRYHFASRTGLLTALAAEGHRLLAGALEDAAGTSFLDVGVAYVRFARDHPGHFTVMFTPDVLDPTDTELTIARSRTFAVLQNGVQSLAADGELQDARAAVVAAWSLVHGFAGLAATGNFAGAGLIDPTAGDDLLDLARRAAGMLHGSPGRESHHA